MLYHFVKFSKVESDFLYLLQFSSYGQIFEHHFLAKTPILSPYMTHLRHNDAGVFKYAGVSTSATYAQLPHLF